MITDYMLLLGSRGKGFLYLTPSREVGGTFGLEGSDQHRVTSRQNFIYSLSQTKLDELVTPEDYSFLFT